MICDLHCDVLMMDDGALASHLPPFLCRWADSIP